MVNFAKMDQNSVKKEEREISPTSDKSMTSPIDDRPHVHEPEHVIEWGGPRNRYGKLNVILGKGAYKIVCKAIDKEEGIEVAWNSFQTSRSEYKEINDEVEILKNVRNSNVITFYDSWYANGEFVFITELMTSGTLREYVKKMGTPSGKIIRRWCKQLLKGLAFLHSHSPPIIHRDIKCDNIFVNGSHGEVKIGDMGTAKMRFGKKYTVIGTPEFMAPEMYEERGYSEKVDIYAFGMCLLEMATGEYPYAECKNAAQIYKKVAKGIKPDCLSQVADRELLNVINNCLRPENERLSAKKLLEHQFLLDEPEVLLVSVNDAKNVLRMQVIFKGSERHSIKFNYDCENDSAEAIVHEMIAEDVLAERHTGIICQEIRRIIEQLSRKGITQSEQTPQGHRRLKSEYQGNAKMSQSKHRRMVSEMSEVSLAPPNKMQPQRRQRKDSSESTENTAFGTLQRSSSKTSLSPEYPNDMSIEEFILELTQTLNRTPEKAEDWSIKLFDQDICTVGDLRDLIDEDWTSLNLTVFATRSIRNALDQHSVSTSKAMSTSGLGSRQPSNQCE